MGLVEICRGNIAQLRENPVFRLVECQVAAQDLAGMAERRGEKNLPTRDPVLPSGRESARHPVDLYDMPGVPQQGRKPLDDRMP